MEILTPFNALPFLMVCWTSLSSILLSCSTSVYLSWDAWGGSLVIVCLLLITDGCGLFGGVLWLSSIADDFVTIEGIALPSLKLNPPLEIQY